MTAVNRDNQDEHPRSNLSKDTNAPQMNQNFMTQVSVKIDGRVIKSKSQSDVWKIRPSNQLKILRVVIAVTMHNTARSTSILCTFTPKLYIFNIKQPY